MVVPLQWQVHDCQCYASDTNVIRPQFLLALAATVLSVAVETSF